MPGNAGSIRAGAAYVELFSDKSKLVRGLKSAEKDLKAWGKNVSGIGRTVAAAGIALTTPFVGAAKLFSDMGSALTDAAARTGVSVESLSTLGFAAEQTGATLEDVETAIKKFAKSGLASGRDVEAGFRGALISLAKIQNPVERSRKAMELFGKSGTKLLPMAMDLATLEDRARRLGLQMSTTDAAAADTLGDAWGELWAVAKMGVFQVGAALAPALTDATNWIIKITAASINWIKENRALVMTTAAVAAGVIGVGVAIMGVGALLSAAGSIVGGVITVMTTLASVLAGIGAAITAVVSPIGLLVAGVVAAGLAFLNFTETGQKMLAVVGGVFQNLWQQAKDTFKGISDALMAGDIKAAADVLWASLKLVWAKGTSEIKTTWNVFLLSILQPTMQLAHKLTDVFIDMAASVIDSILKVIDAINSVVDLGDVISGALGLGLVDPKGKAIKDAFGFLAKTKDFAPDLKDRAHKTIDSTGIGLGIDAGNGIIDATKDLTDAQKAFDDAVKAAAKAKDRPEVPGGKPLPIPGISLDTTSVSGTFSAAAAQGIGGTSQLDQIADATKQTAKNTKNIANLKAGIGFI